MKHEQRSFARAHQEKTVVELHVSDALKTRSQPMHVLSVALAKVPLEIGHVTLESQIPVTAL